MFYIYIYFDPEINILYENEYFKSNLQPMYIGKGSGNRYKKHLRNNPDNPMFNARIKELQDKKIDIPISIILSNKDDAETFVLEEKLIEMIGRRNINTGPLYNITKGGAGGYKCSNETKLKISKGNTGKIVSQETKLKQSNASKGVPKSAEHKEKLSKSLQGNIPWNKGKTRIYSEETLDKMRNKVFTEESKQKMSISQRGKTQSEEHRKKNSEANTGRVVSDETKKKMSEAKKEYWKNKKDNNGN
jgi:hypothetical protein